MHYILCIMYIYNNGPRGGSPSEFEVIVGGVRALHVEAFDVVDERVGVGGADGAVERPLLAVPILHPAERDFFIDNLLVRVHLNIESQEGTTSNVLMSAPVDQQFGIGGADGSTVWCRGCRVVDQRVGVGGADGAVERPLLAVPILHKGGQRVGVGGAERESLSNL